MTNKSLDELEEENEKRSVEVSLREKMAIIREYKKRYGRDWRKFIPMNWKTGLDWQALKFQIR